MIGSRAAAPAGSRAPPRSGNPPRDSDTFEGPNIPESRGAAYAGRNAVCPSGPVHPIRVIHEARLPSHPSPVWRTWVPHHRVTRCGTRCSGHETKGLVTTESPGAPLSHQARRGPFRSPLSAGRNTVAERDWITACLDRVMAHLLSRAARIGLARTANGARRRPTVTRMQALSAGGRLRVLARQGPWQQPWQQSVLRVSAV